MGKIWILSPFGGECCGCAGKSGPCSTCFTCSGYFPNSSQVVLDGDDIPVNKFARFGETSDCEIVIADGGSSLTTVSSQDDYTVYNFDLVAHLRN